VKTIGIVGGLSAESAAEYYLTITRTHQARRGDDYYPEIVLHSVCFGRWTDWARAGDWNAVGDALVASAERLHAAGAELGVIASNTMHLGFGVLERRSPIPFISIVEVVARALAGLGVTRAAVTGTRFTMMSGLYPDGLERRDIGVVVPSEEDRAMIDGAIYGELVRGVVRAGTRDAFLRVLERLAENGAQAVIMGCTEIPLLMAGHERRSPLPLVDTSRLHAVAAYEAAVQGPERVG
jgi:aspartate racemase